MRPGAVLTALINETAALPGRMILVLDDYHLIEAQPIHSRLYLSLNTVKVHTRSIYSKLDVHSRMQAVARARAWGISVST